MEKEKLIEEAQERYPFLTGITYGGNEYVGIVVNHDNTICTFYDIGKMKSKQFYDLNRDHADKKMIENINLKMIDGLKS